MTQFDGGRDRTPPMAALPADARPGPRFSGQRGRAHALIRLDRDL
jgi:hypothetical protein